MSRNRELTKIRREDYLELVFNLAEFLKIRETINYELFATAFILEIYKEQLRIFFPTDLSLLVGIGMQYSNIFKNFISLDKLKSSAVINTFKRL